jgi:hypothetical protein
MRRAELFNNVPEGHIAQVLPSARRIVLLYKFLFLLGLNVVVERKAWKVLNTFTEWRNEGASRQTATRKDRKVHVSHW